MKAHHLILRWNGVVPNIRRQPLWVSLFEVPGLEPWPFTVVFTSLN